MFCAPKVFVCSFVSLFYINWLALAQLGEVCSTWTCPVLLKLLHNAILFLHCRFAEMGFAQSLIEKYSIAVSVETLLHFRLLIPAICPCWKWSLQLGSRERDAGLLQPLCSSSALPWATSASAGWWVLKWLGFSRFGRINQGSKWSDEWMLEMAGLLCLVAKSNWIIFSNCASRQRSRVRIKPVL